MRAVMKIKYVSKYIYVTTIILCIFVFLVIFKLNSYYKNEKTQTVQNQMSQQNLGLKTSISTQLSQLKNILSSYSYRIDENKLNWMQIDPLTVMAQVHLTKDGRFEVRSLFTKSGSKTENWTKDFLQKALSLKKHSGKSIHADLFQTKSGQKYLALTFAEGLALSDKGVEAITVVGDANYFQKFFDLNRSRKTTHLLMTDASIVAGHNESEYIATVTSEGAINPNNYFVQMEDLRSANLKIISYCARGAVLSFLNIPIVLLGLILGFFCIFIGILFYAFRPIEKTIHEQKMAERDVVYKQTVLQTINHQQEAEKTELKIFEKPKLPPILSELVTEPEVIQPRAQPQEMILPDNFKFIDQTSNINIPDSMSAVLQNVVSELQPTCLAKGIRLQSDFKSINEIEFDPQRFKKMFQQLLKNSIEAVESSAIKNIFVRCYDSGSSTVVEIQDTGEGITSENLEKIWQPYFSTKEKSMHQGLGLSEALSVARRYGGELVVRNVSNDDGGGAILQLTMPGKNMQKNKNSDIQGAIEKTTEIDLDQLLSLDDEVLSDDNIQNFKQPVLDLKKEFMPTQFKMDRRVQILEEPDIQIQKTEKPIDQFKVQIRGPQKS